MFKALTPFRLTSAQPFGAAELGAQLLALPFTPCGPTQAKSAGFVPPRGHAHGAMVEAVGHEWIAKVMIEKRMLPASVVRDRVDELAKKIEQETGRKPGSKRRRELKDEAMIDLLPQAFTKQVSAFVWIHAGGAILAIGSTSSAVVDDVLTLFSKAAPGVMLLPLNTKEAPAKLMRELLLGGDEADESQFHPGREAELVDPALGNPSVRYSKHSLAGDDVRQHLAQGKTVKSLALEFGDALTFTLDDCLRLKKIEIDEGAFMAQGDEDPFDADVIIATATLAPALDALVFELGGAVDFNPQQESTT